MFSLSNPNELLSLAEAAAKASGSMLKKSSTFGIGEYRDRDVKLAQDKASEKIIIEHLQAASDLPILSEEAGWVGNNSAVDGTPYWAVDPLDGSFNYHRDIPLCCV